MNRGQRSRYPEKNGAIGHRGSLKRPRAGAVRRVDDSRFVVPDAARPQLSRFRDDADEAHRRAAGLVTDGRAPGRLRLDAAQRQGRAPLFLGCGARPFARSI